jgi:hypothetical protein
MIGAPVDTHINLFRHVAFHAERSLARFALDFFLVEVVLVTVVRLVEMALQAQVVALLVELEAVYVMAVVTTDTVRVHLALHERPPDIVLFEDLPIGMIGALDQKRRDDTLICR